MKIRTVICGQALTLLGVFLALLGCKTQPTMRWIVYYGSQLTEKDLKGVDLAILDPDQLNPKQLAETSPVTDSLSSRVLTRDLLEILHFVQDDNRTTTHPVYVAYLSVGEAEEHRPFWPRVKGSSYLVEANPEWPGAHRIDLRSEVWRQLLLKEVIPAIVVKGYQGLFLDTLDVPLYLEEKDPKKYAGSKQAAIAFVKMIHQQFPNLKLLPNNGLTMLRDYGDIIDGVVVEDLYTRYDFKTQESIATPAEESQYKEKLLDEFRAQFGKPVFNILYEKSPKGNLPETPLAKYAIKRSQEKGYLWYLTTVDLMSIGYQQP